MSLPRFFVPLPLMSGVPLSLSGDVRQHLHVLRLMPGDTLVLFNGEGGEFSATLTAIDKKSASVMVGSHSPREAELPYRLTLAQGIASREKMDWLIEKSVELGVSAIVPLLTAKSVVRLTEERALQRCLHWQALVRSACEQCGRNRLPAIAAPIALNEWLTTLPSSAAAPVDLRLMPSPRAARNLGSVSMISSKAPAGSTCILIGPEGGLTEAEEQAASAHGFTAINLGSRILRTETAGIAILASLAAYWDGWR